MPSKKLKSKSNNTPKYEHIINPETGEKVSLYSQDGGKILSKYVRIFKKLRNEKKENNGK